MFKQALLMYIHSAEMKANDVVSGKTRPHTSLLMPFNPVPAHKDLIIESKAKQKR
jgi:hypothetical protein